MHFSLPPTSRALLRDGGDLVGSILSIFLMCQIVHAVDAPAGAVPGTVEFRVGQTRVQGLILGWTASDILLLERDGRLRIVERALTADFRKISDRFTPVSREELRSELRRQFGGEYTVDSTPHYLVVRPSAVESNLAETLEAFFREAWRYCQKRRLPVHDPLLPLVAVVYKDRSPTRGLRRLLPRAGSPPRWDCTIGYPTVASRTSSRRLRFPKGVFERCLQPPRRR